MKKRIAAVSPLHIGTGRPLEPFEYITENNKFIRLDENKAFSLALDADPDFPDKYSNWLETTSRSIDATRNNQDQATLRANFNFRNFCQTVLQNPELARRLSTDCAKYVMDMPYGLAGKKQIDELLKDSNHKPYIPGSSIKGSIRTALVANAFALLSSQEKATLMSDILKTISNYKVRGQDIAASVEEHILLGGTRKAPGDKPLFKDIKYDLLKFLRVGDALAVDAAMQMIPVNMYLGAKPPQGQANAHEVIAAGSIFEFDIRFDINEFREVLLHTKNNVVWVDAESKFRKLLGIPQDKNLVTLTEENILEMIENIVRRFYKKSLDKDIDWSKYAKENSAKLLAASWKNIPMEKKILKIGKGSGFTATTIFNSFDLNNKAEKEFLQKLFDKFRIGYPRVKAAKELSAPNLQKFPKSKKMTSANLNTPVAPFGWCVIIGEHETFTAPDWTPIFTANMPDPAQVPVKKAEEKLSAEQYIQNNKDKKYSNGEMTEAVFVKNEGKKVIVKILHPDYDKTEFTFNYGAWQILEEKKIFKVRVSDSKAGKITVITFGGLLD